MALLCPGPGDQADLRHQVGAGEALLQAGAGAGGAAQPDEDQEAEPHLTASPRLIIRSSEHLETKKIRT